MLAIYSAVHAARDMAIREHRPVLIEVRLQRCTGFLEHSGLFKRPKLETQLLTLLGFHLKALTYRVGHHSTSDDSTKYRSAEEIEWWRLARDPVTRFRQWIESNGWWNAEAESEHRYSVRKQVRFATLLCFLVH